MCVQRVAVVNETTDGGYAKCGLERSGQKFWSQTLTLTTKGLVYAQRSPVWCPSDYRVRVEIHGATSGDVVRVFIFGYIHPD